MTVVAMPRREAVRELAYAVLAVVSILIGFSRLVPTTTGVPVWVKGVDVLIAVAFTVDFVGRIRASPRSGRYALRHAWEVVTLIPFTLIPGADGGSLVRSVRLLRLFRVLRYARFVRLGVSLVRLPKRVRYVQRVVDEAQVVNIFVAGLVTMAAGAAALLAFESRVNPRMDTYAEAFWWALNIFTTTAYAVPDPATRGGYITSAVLMVLGVGFIGVFTASLAGAILRSPRPEEEDEV